MVLQLLEIAVRDGQEAAFETALCDVRQQVFMTAGFRGFAAAQGVEQASTYLVQVRWETLDELAAAVASGRLDRCWALVGPFLAGPPRVTHHVERPGLGFQGPGSTADLESALG